MELLIYDTPVPGRIYAKSKAWEPSRPDAELAMY